MTPSKWNKHTSLIVIALVGFLVALGYRSLAGYAAITALLTLAYDLRQGGRSGMTALLGAALILLMASPDLSDDYHRYLWEGYAQHQGYSPYTNTPVSLQQRLEHSSASQVNHPNLTAIYPPLAQLLFAAAAAIHPSVFGWKAIIALALLVTAWFNRQATLALLTIPLVLSEGLWNAHLDILGILPIVLLPNAIDRQRGWQAGLLLGLSCAIKLVPVIWLPFIWTQISGRQRWIFCLVFGAVFAGSFLPYINNGWALFDSFWVYTRTWQFNSLFYTALAAVIEPVATRATLLLLFALSYLVILCSNRGWRHKLIASWLALIVFSPTFYPWYLIWLAPLVRGRQINWLNAAYLSAFISYTILIGYRATGVWQESLWWLVPEWVLLLTTFVGILAGEGEHAQAH